jgi:hypothetical protein
MAIRQTGELELEYEYLVANLFIGIWTHAWVLDAIIPSPRSIAHHAEFPSRIEFEGDVKISVKYPVPFLSAFPSPFRKKCPYGVYT